MDHTAEDLLKRSNRKKCPAMRASLSTVSACTQTRTLVAEQLKVSRTSVNTWVSIHIASGLEGLEAVKQKDDRLSFDCLSQLKILVTLFQSKAR